MTDETKTQEQPRTKKPALLAENERLRAFAYNVLAALEENGAEANIANIIADARAALAKAEVK